MTKLRKNPCKEVSLGDLRKATEKMARIVEIYGDKYWPLFDRLDRELRQREERSQRLARYSSTQPTPANDHSERIYDAKSSDMG